MIIRCAYEMESSLLEAIVELHLRTFQGFFLTSMGRSFLRLLYAGFIVDAEGICLVAEEDGQLIGFAAGTTRPDDFFRRLFLRKGLMFAFASIPGLLRNPRLAIRKCIGAIAYRGERPVGLVDAALLSSLAVDPARGRRGVGRELVEAFVGEASARGMNSVFLTTDADDNDSVNRFYVKCGFVRLDRFERPGNRTMNRLARRIT